MEGDKAMGKKRLMINLIANLVSYASSMIISFYLTPFLVSHLGKEVYGFYGLANNVVNYVSILSIALNSMAAKYITVELVRGNKIKAEQYYSSIFFSNVILSAIITPALLIIIFKVQSIFNISDTYLKDVRILFALVFSTMILNLVFSVVGSATYAKNRVDLKAYSNIGRTLLRIFLYVLLFTVFKPSIVYVGVVALVLELYNSIAQYVIKQKIMPELKVAVKNFSLPLIVETLKVGVWNSLNHLGDLLLSSSDLMLANIMIGESAGGTISIIKTMPSLLSGIITAINGVFMPRISTRYGENNIKKLVEEVHISQRIMGVMTTSVVMMLIIYGKEFYELWVPGNDSNLLMILSALDVSRMMIVGVTWPVANLNIVTDRIKIPSLLVIVSGVLNVSSMYLLIKYTGLGIYSIPLTTLVLTVCYYGFFIPIYPCKFLNVSKTTFFKPVLEMLLSASLIFVIIQIFKQFIIVDSWFSFLLFGGISGIISLMISMLVFFKPSGIKDALLIMSEWLKNRNRNKGLNNDNIS